jgi:hypothetical protein
LAPRMSELYAGVNVNHFCPSRRRKSGGKDVRLIEVDPHAAVQ